jgi:hypothetical protein
MGLAEQTPRYVRQQGRPVRHRRHPYVRPPAFTAHQETGPELRQIHA